MKIKRFYELFDSEEMKDFVFSSDPSAEIDFLTKNLQKYTKIDYSPKKKTIETLLLKIINYRYPFISIFLLADKNPDSIIETSEFDIMTRYDEDEKFHAFILANPRFMVIFSIRVNVDNYDVNVSVYDIEFPDEIQTFEQNGLTFDDVVDIIEDEYIPQIQEYGFGDVLSYNYITKLQRYN